MPKALRTRQGRSKNTKRRTKKSARSPKMNREVKEYKSQPVKYFDLLKRVDKWMAEYVDEIMALLSLHVKYSTDFVSHEIFKSAHTENEALFSMDFPFTQLETHIITDLYDRKKEGRIYFEDLSTNLRLTELSEYCQMRDEKNQMLNNYKIWIFGRFHCSVCPNIKESPLYFEEILPIDTFTEGIVSIIRHRTGIIGPDIEVFSSNDLDPENRLKPLVRLSDQGFEGDEEWSPKEIDFYYKICDLEPEKWSKLYLREAMTFAHDALMWADLL